MRYGAMAVGKSDSLFESRLLSAVIFTIWYSRRGAVGHYDWRQVQPHLSALSSSHSIHRREMVATPMYRRFDFKA